MWFFFYITKHKVLYRRATLITLCNFFGTNTSDLVTNSILSGEWGGGLKYIQRSPQTAKRRQHLYVLHGAEINTFILRHTLELSF